MDWIKFGQVLRQKRISKGLKQYDIARLANVSTTMISYIENAHKKTNADTLMLISKAMDINIFDI